MRVVSFKIFLVLFVILGVILGRQVRKTYLKHEVVDVNQGNILDACKQKAETRVWQEIKLDTVFSIYEYGKGKLLYPFKVFVDRKGNFYVLDFYAFGVFKFSGDGKFISKYGKGKGEGPGEFKQPVDFYVSDDGMVYVCDMTLGFITVFDKNGNVNKTIKIEGIPARIVVLNDKTFVIQRFGGNMFQRYNLSGNVISSFEQLFKERSFYTIPADVRLIYDGSYIYGAFVRGGYLFSYSADGNLKYLCETIDRFPMPEFVVRQEKGKNKSVIGVGPDPNAPISAIDISVGDSLIYLLAGTASKREKGVVVDVYNKFSGQYLYSFKFSKPFDVEGVSSLFVFNGYIFTAEILKNGDARVRKYKIRFKSG